MPAELTRGLRGCGRGGGGGVRPAALGFPGTVSPRGPDGSPSLDVETFVADTLRGENLSKKAKEKREFLIKKIKDVKSIYLQDFQDKGDAEDGEEYDDPFAGPPDTVSLASERYDKDDEAHSEGNQFPPIAAQDLPFVLKAGYLEKRRKDHSFLGFEWQKRWCALSKTVFYYYGSDKGSIGVQSYQLLL
ncbi:src kinase-associated phosphoprotein 2 isoform X3 [Ursus arctos]|uniref:src kinase-associated phosphoprotein 2 isoform X3 n=1 Tax=Ursus arctos TaxID=9644 RepID=UPI0025493AC3|nr:src kinase-associated phosphoprotein 2 isoform X3 [Ursus arctos]